MKNFQTVVCLVLKKVYQKKGKKIKKDYDKNKILRFAIIKNLEIVGEASYMLSKDFKNKHNEIEWQVIIALRHLVHGYYNEVWNIIQIQNSSIAIL